jgi:hypothetical protein
MYTFRNPPPASWAATDKARSFLHDTMHSNCLFTLRHAACAPFLAIEMAQVEPLAEGLYKVSAVVANHGFLPTHLTQRALDHRTASEVSAVITLPEGAALRMGQPSETLGHLAGRDERRATWSPWMRDWHSSRRRVEWLVQAPAGGSVRIRASSARAGVAEIALTLA